MIFKNKKVKNDDNGFAQSYQKKLESAPAKNPVNSSRKLAPGFLESYKEKSMTLEEHKARNLKNYRESQPVEIDLNKYRVEAEEAIDVLHRELSWFDIEPSKNPFDRRDAEEYLTELLSGDLDPVPCGETIHIIRQEEIAKAGSTSYYSGYIDDWMKVLTLRLVKKFGVWAKYWDWTSGEGSHGGGPVTGWCCVEHSMKDLYTAKHSIVSGLAEWRSWLEQMEYVFLRYKLGEEKLDEKTWTTVFSEIITRTLETTGAEDAWYGFAYTNLHWALEKAGIADGSIRQRMIEESQDGKWESWVEISKEQIENTAKSLAQKTTQGQ